MHYNVSGGYAPAKIMREDHISVNLQDGGGVFTGSCKKNSGFTGAVGVFFLAQLVFLDIQELLELL